MSLISEVANLMYDEVTIHRLLTRTNPGQGGETFSPLTELVKPVRITRRSETVYPAGGTAVETRGKIIMPIPTGPELKKHDKLVSGYGEVFRVHQITRKRDKDSYEYLVVVVA